MEQHTPTAFMFSSQSRRSSNSSSSHSGHWSPNVQPSAPLEPAGAGACPPHQAGWAADRGSLVVPGPAATWGVVIERVAELRQRVMTVREARATALEQLAPGFPAYEPTSSAPWQAALASAPPLPPTLAGADWADSSDDETEPEAVATARAEAAFQSALATAQRVVAKLAGAVKADIPPLVSSGVARRNTA